MILNEQEHIFGTVSDFCRCSTGLHIQMRSLFMVGLRSLAEKSSPSNVSTIPETCQTWTSECWRVSAVLLNSSYSHLRAAVFHYTACYSAFVVVLSYHRGFIMLGAVFFTRAFHCESFLRAQVFEHHNLLFTLHLFTTHSLFSGRYRPFKFLSVVLFLCCCMT